MASTANSRYFAKGKTGNAIHDNGAAVIFGGNVSGTNVTKSMGIEGLGTVKSTSTKVPLSLGWTRKGTTGGDFANIHVGKYLINGIVNYIAGVANTVLSKPGTPATTHRWSTNRNESHRTELARTAGWNYVTGAFLTAPSVSAATFKSIDATSAVDRAARTTRSAPGNVYYIVGKTATTKALAARTQ